MSLEEERLRTALEHIRDELLRGNTRGYKDRLWAIVDFALDPANQRR
jgi:hypothetical protein